VVPTPAIALAVGALRGFRLLLVTFFLLGRSRSGNVGDLVADADPFDEGFETDFSASRMFNVGDRLADFLTSRTPLLTAFGWVANNDSVGDRFRSTALFTSLAMDLGEEAKRVRVGDRFGGVVGRDFFVDRDFLLDCCFGKGAVGERDFAEVGATFLDATVLALAFLAATGLDFWTGFGFFLLGGVAFVGIFGIWPLKYCCHSLWYFSPFSFASSRCLRVSSACFLLRAVASRSRCIESSRAAFLSASACV